ncbi:MAG: MFS transporter [Acidobacteria bacterium]|nr:MFS transporter [Acidobacteriota bacterium]
MVGLERSILPQIAEAEFAIAAKTALFSFIVVFGFVKAFTNYFTGALANRFGRRNLLILGWLFGLPVPFILMYAPSWNWIIAANVLLGINQGLAWSSTVVMKIDLIGERNRGLAMGLNEFAGYVSVGLIAFVTGWVAGEYGLRPYPFYIGIAMAAIGLAMSVFLIRDTRRHVARESETSQAAKLRSIFWDTTLRDRNLGSITQAGLVNNLNDGMVWGILPVILAAKRFSLPEIGAITAIYPAVWGFGQLFTGKMADHFDKKRMLFVGMLLQGLALLVMPFAETMAAYIGLATLLGCGTAMVYPTFLAAIAEITHPEDRPKSVGVFRLWRDLGYAFGAILTGIIADSFGLSASVITIGALTILSAAILQLRMNLPKGLPAAR